MSDLLKFKNKIGLPEAVVEVIEKSITTEYASLTKDGTPITYPVTPYVSPDGMTISISTGLTYPTKAERARNNPYVSLLFSNPVGTGIKNPPIVQILGHGVVRDSNLQENTNRYMKISALKLPVAASAMPQFLAKRLVFYYARIWIEILPLQVRWWDNGDLNAEPNVWEIDSSIPLPTSDPKPAPLKEKFDSYTNAPLDWGIDLDIAIAEMGQPVLTTVVDGYPLPIKVQNIKRDGDTVVLKISNAAKVVASGKACLTFHEHDADFSYQSNRVFVGRADIGTDDKVSFTVKRQIGDWSLKGNQLMVFFDFIFRKGRKLNKRLKIEAERRGQPIPTVEF